MLELDQPQEISEHKTLFSINNKPIRGILQLAVELNHNYIVEQLVRSAIDVNSIDKGGKTAFDIAVAEDRQDLKQILLKRNDLIPNQYDVELSEHPLRICILDKDQASTRSILENQHFSTYMTKKLECSPFLVESELSRLLFDVFMVFKDDYKSSIFVMHDLIAKCGANLNYFDENINATPLLLLAMRNSFKEVIYAIVKNLVKLDSHLVTKLH